MHISDIFKRILYGVIEGLLYYLVFIVLVPFITSSILGISLDIVQQDILVFYLTVFISLGVIASTLPYFLGLLFEVISYLLGILILVSLLMGGVYRTSIEYQGALVHAEVDFKTILLVIIGFGVVSTIVSIFQRVATSED